MKKILSIALAAMMVLALFSAAAETMEEKQKDFEERLSQVHIVNADGEERTPLQKTGDYVIKCFLIKEYDRIFQLCNPDFIGDLGGYPQSLELIWRPMLDQYGDVQEARYDHMEGYEERDFVVYILQFAEYEVEFAVILDVDGALDNVSVFSISVRTDVEAEPAV